MPCCGQLRYWVRECPKNARRITKKACVEAEETGTSLRGVAVLQLWKERAYHVAMRCPDRALFCEDGSLSGLGRGVGRQEQRLSQRAVAMSLIFCGIPDVYEWT